MPQFGAILFRAAELIGQQGSQALDALGVDFDARHTSVLLVLYTQGPKTSSELAEIIGHSRQLIEARLKSARGRRVFASRPDPHDTRRRLYEIAADAQPVAETVHAIMREFEPVYDALWAEVGVDLEQALLKMEARLADKPLIERLQDSRAVDRPPTGAKSK